MTVRDSRAAAPQPEGKLSDNAVWTLVVVSVATFMLMLDLTVVNVALPDIRKSFDSSFSALQWILDAYALGLAAILLAAGSVADRIGRKKVFDAGLVIFLVASLICGIAQNDVTLILARFVQGLGGAILFAVGPALLGNEFHGKQRGMAFGVFGGVAGLAIAFGPLIGGGLAESAGWRWIFLINIPLTVAALAVGWFKMRESRGATPPPLDWSGMITFSAGLFFLVLAFMRGQQDGWTSAQIIAYFVIAIVLLIIFVGLQISRPGRAMFDLSLFRNRTFNGLSVVTALCAVSVMSALFLLISYIQNVLGYSAFSAGLRLLPLTLLMFVAAAACGSLVAKVAPSVIIGGSQLFITAGLACVLLVDDHSGWTRLIPAMVLIGFGMGMFSTPRGAFAIAVTTPDKSGMASGVNETFQQSGLAVGIAALGAYFQNRVNAAYNKTDIAAQLHDKAPGLGDLISAGAGREAAKSLPAQAAEQFQQAATSAYVSGLHHMMAIAAVIAAISAVVGVLTLRRSDLDDTALANPGVPPEAAVDPARGVSAY
ncbi:MFS transporter [Nocardia sp. BMG111209]|uniref:MFS transporter n=1 Tax=Nocardia sp. BMG111209 TaxID=1160137 RepID=UPI0003A5994D|nr:MFS transporter [Nocardia sp. BMG111209]